MASAWFDTPATLLAGAATGLVFGFLLQKGGVSRFSVIVDQLRLKDFTVMKVMLTAIVVGGLGIFGMRVLGADFPMHVKASALGAVLGGGLVFGVGMALLGYCPGTAFAALGDGSRHAWFGVLGMLVGAAVFAEVFPWLDERLLSRGDLGKATLDSLLGVGPWAVIVPLTLAAGGVFWWMERSPRRPAGV
jgi:uncharacterized membrane protein YedE/YeeE